MAKHTQDQQAVGLTDAEEFLLSFGASNPAALALLGALYLKQWETSGDTKYLERALAALQCAADQGEPEANWQLYRYVIEKGKREGRTYNPSKYLLDDEAKRKDHLRRAAKAGHEVAKAECLFLSEAQEQNQSLLGEMNNDRRSQREGEFKSKLADINHLRPMAQQGDKHAQLDLAQLLMETYRDAVFEGIPATSPHLWRQEAKEMLQSAATELPEARYLLVSNGFVEGEAAAIELLRAAAFPKQGEEPYPLALMELASRLIERQEYAEAEKYLREAIFQGVGAEKHLADLIYEHHGDFDGDLAESLSLYEMLVERSKEPLAAFRAGQMYLRGVICLQDMDKARRFFEIGAKSSHHGHDFGDADSRAGLPLDWFDHYIAPPLYCRLALVLGWPGSGNANCRPFVDGTRLLLDRLAQRRCQAEDLDFLQHSDVLKLLKTMNWYQSLEIQRDPKDAIGQEYLEEKLSPLLGLIRLLAEKSFSGTDANRYFKWEETRSTFLEEENRLALGWLLVSGKLGDSNPGQAEEHFMAARRRLRDIKLESVAYEDGLSDRETRAEWLGRQIHEGLRYCAEMKAAKAQAEKEAEVYKAREEERRQMISFLSHTLVSVTAGASRMLREIMNDLTTASDHTTVTTLAARLAPTAIRASVVENLVKVFKLYTSNPDALREGWALDQGGDHSVAQTVVLALQMSILRFCRMPDFRGARRKLLPQADYDALIEEFIVEILPLDGSTMAQIQQIAKWLEKRLPFLRVALNEVDQIRIQEEGARHIVIFALVVEFLTNALKYVAPGGEISLSICHTDGGLDLACSNPVDSDTAVRPLSGKTGLDFVRAICKLIGAEFHGPSISNGSFSLHAILPLE